MANSTRTTRVPGVIAALIIAGALIGGAYVLSTGWNPLKAATVNAASTQQLLQEYSQKDSDGDGLPDWEESLYGTDPKNVHSVSPTMTDAEAVSQGLVKPKFSSATPSSTIDTSSIPGSVAATGTITAQFAQTLFSDYLSQSNGTPPSADQVSAYVQSAMQDLVQKHANQNIYSAANEQVSGTGTSALTSYAAHAEQAFAANTTSEDKNEIDYFADAVEKNDASALPEIAIIGKAYTETANDFIKVPVPSEAAAAHLALANALARVGDDITDMSMFNSDPLRAYLGLSQYQIDAPAMLSSFGAIGKVLTSSGVSIPSGSGSSFYKEATTLMSQ